MDKIRNKDIKTALPVIRFVSRTLITVIVTLTVLILFKKDSEFKTDFYKEVYNKSFSFMDINNLFEDIFGSSIPLKDLFSKATPVFSEDLKYTGKSVYYDGVALEVDTNYLVPTLETGLVIFVGEKDNYGKTIIVQQIDGIDLWYGNLENTNVKLYDYIEKGTLVGNVKDNKLYLVYQNDGKAINYEDYLEN